MKRILALALVAAIAAPSVAAAATDDPALAQERYYSSYGKSGPIESLQPAPAEPIVVTESGDPGPWKLVAIGAGALVLVLGAAELVTLGRLRAVRAG